jgi:hypothetical protein
MSISTGGIIGIAIGAAVVIGVGGWLLKSNSDAADNYYNLEQQRLSFDERVQSGGKKSKRRKGRKNASKKRR